MIKHLLTAFFAELEKRPIPFCVLRNYESLPDYTSNDVDILVSRTFFKDAVQLLLAASRKAGLKHHIQIEHACLLMMFHSQEDYHSQCHIDLYADITWKGFPIADPGKILASRLPYKGFYIPDPAWEQAVNLLVRLLYHGRVKEEYKAMIHKTALDKDHGTKYLSALKKSLGKHEGGILWTLAKNADWNSMEKRAWKIQKAVIFKNMAQNPTGLFKRQSARFMRLARRLMHPAGLSVAIIGPDGAGKSSVIKGLYPVLDMTFKDAKQIVHWRPELVKPSKNLKQVVDTNPHKKPVRNKPLSLLFFIYHTLMFILGYWIRLAPLRFKGWAIFLDRYYYDFFTDLKRFRLAISKKWVHLGYFWVPKPDIVLLLDAPPGVIRKRKQEVTKEETARQCSAYRDLIHWLPNGYIVNADQSLDRVVDDALNIIMNFLSKRVEHQRKKVHEKNDR